MATTVKSGYWNDSYSFISGNHPREKELKRLLRRRGMRKTQELIMELLGAAAGATASVTYKRVAPNGATNGVPTPVGALGGSRLMETRTQINRATTAADDTRITNLLSRRPGPLTYPGDKSGNGK